MSRFLFEMLLTFVTGVYDAGVYRDGFIWVSTRYLRGLFWFSVFCLLRLLA